MKKVVFVIFLALPLFVFALEKNYSPPPVQDVACDEDLFAKDKRAILVNAEFLYWSAQAGNLQYAISQRHPVWAPPAVGSASGKYEAVKFDWAPGFRVSLGYFNAPKFWEVRAHYTWLSVSGSDSVKEPTENDVYLNGTFHRYFESPIAFAKSHVNLDLNLADLLAARVFIPNPHLRLRLLGGLTGGRLNEEWKIEYYGRDAADYSYVKNKWKFTGAGFRAGLDADWFWTSDIYLTGKISAAALMGKYVMTTFQKTTSAAEDRDPNIPAADAIYEDYRLAMNFQALLGPSWQKAFCSSRWELFAGYEFNHWQHLQEYIFSNSGEADDIKAALQLSSGLTFHGLVVRLSVDF